MRCRFTIGGSSSGILFIVCVTGIGHEDVADPFTLPVSFGDVASDFGKSTSSDTILLTCNTASKYCILYYMLLLLPLAFQDFVLRCGWYDHLTVDFRIAAYQVYVKPYN